MNDYWQWQTDHRHMATSTYYVTVLTLMVF